MRSIKHSFIQNIIFLFLITTNNCLSSDFKKIDLFNDPNKLKKFIFYEYTSTGKKNFEIRLPKSQLFEDYKKENSVNLNERESRIKELTINWKQVMNEQNENTLEYFLKNYDGKIERIDNYIELTF